jgi:choline kinase/mannose-6-phosphate isomerase-like protein (cupin superfamily)
MHKVVHKPWGKEEWLELNDSYCYKRIYINAGYKTSFQYHNYKKETNYIISGKAEVWLENDKGIIEKKFMKAGDFFNVKPPKKHRVIAITDIILQEVSTPEVDDVIRINDEFKRSDGKIEAEHETPAVLILAAGLGSRLGNLTNDINKAQIPINNRAIISRIIDKFPKNYDFFIALGYKGEELKQYCSLAFPHLNINYLYIEDYDGNQSGPGATALKFKDKLQRPFYITVADCIIDSDVPHLDGNWLGVQPTSYPEKYSTLNIDSNNNIISFSEKSKHGFDYAFIGIASIWDYSIFWKELEKNMVKGELVNAFENFSKYPSFKAKKLKWLDTGNLDDLNTTKVYFKDKPLSLSKVTGEITYKENTFIKFNPNLKLISNLSKRAEKLKGLIPNNFRQTKNFISYDWAPGETIYNCNSYNIYVKFLDFFENILKESKIKDVKRKSVDEFYKKKTLIRKDKFISKYGEGYYNNKFTINGINYDSMKDILNYVDYDLFYSNSTYNNFHGDLQFDNVIFNEDNGSFTYIDWRESFAGNTDEGDIYYDLSKLYGGLLMPYNLMKKEDLLKYEEGESLINFSYEEEKSLIDFKPYYEKWIHERGFDLKKIKLITALIYINMSPLHDEKFGKILWFKSIEMFSYANK